MRPILTASCLAIALVASTGNGWAQNIGGGVKVGVNVATLSGDIDAEKSARTGLAVGGFLTVSKGGPLAFQPEVLFSAQGVKGKEGSDEITYKINEVQIPLLLRVNGSSGAHFLVGPSIGVITGAKAEFGSEEFDLKDDLKSTDVGLVVGAGMSVRRFLIEARYTAGLTNILADGSSDVNKSRVFTVLFGVGF